MMSESPFRPAAKEAAVRVPLAGGLIALVDPQDASRVGRYKWKPLREHHGSIYATRSTYGDGRVTTVLMHRFVVGAPAGVGVDHRNRDTLDNRRANLRLATMSQNQANTVSRGGTSRFKGVSWDRRRRLWKAQLAHRTVGRFGDETEAAVAYDVAAFERWGTFALLNFPAVDAEETHND
jgi:hypothetical protein